MRLKYRDRFDLCTVPPEHLGCRLYMQGQQGQGALLGPQLNQSLAAWQGSPTCMQRLVSLQKEKLATFVSFLPQRDGNYS